MGNFVLLQPGCDMSAVDVATFNPEESPLLVKYIVDRGGDPEFFRMAAVGDAMPFDRERVVLCVGKVWNLD